MLKGIPACFSPELMSILMRMGHGDEIVLADAHFPAESCAKRLIRADGLSIPALLDAILRFFPLDTFVADPALVMQPVDRHAPEPPIWQIYRELLQKHEQRTVPVMPLERFAFYERARSAFAVIATGDTATYANLVLKKGLATGE